jgi:uncharacterized membrane protein
MKTCARCHIEKSLTEFYPRRGHGGFASHCKPCKALRAKEYRAANSDACRARSLQWHNDNREASIANTVAWQRANLEAHRATKKAYYESNRQDIRARWREWRDANRHIIKALKAQRRAALKLAVPAWADRAAIRAVYAKAALLSMTTGVEHSVDHIVPLQSPLVCGLHVEHNLRAIPRRENESKGNRWWPDMTPAQESPTPQRAPDMAAAVP